MPPYSIFIYFI